MSREQNTKVLELLTSLFQDNVGNRLTAALANGMLHAVDQEMSRWATHNAPGGRTIDVGEMQGVIVKGPAVATQ